MSAISSPNLFRRSPAVASPGAAIAGAACASRRRLMLLLVAMMLMGLADLLCTLTYMRSVGMIEANPLARLMVTIGDGRQLILFKLFTMALSCGSLFLARRDRRAELSAWICTLVMLALSVHWIVYNRSISAMTNEVTVLASRGGSDLWVKLDR